MTYNQTFVLFGLVSTCVWIPIYIAVLPNKTEATYERLYNLIDMSMAAEQISFRVDTEVMFDFEAAQRNAWSRLHPSHRLLGCHLQKGMTYKTLMYNISFLFYDRLFD